MPDQTLTFPAGTTGGQILQRVLTEMGVEAYFQMPGESYGAFTDALDAAGIPIITGQTESGAMGMGVAYAQIRTFRQAPDVTIVTRGPGAGNTLTYVTNARRASIPHLVIAGLPPTDQWFNPLTGERRELSQGIDLERIFGDPLVSKGAFVATRIEDLAELAARAVYTTGEGRTGPTVLGVPTDVLDKRLEHELTITIPSPWQPPAPDRAALEAIADWIIAHPGERLAIEAGEEITYDPLARMALVEFAALTNAAVVTTNRHPDVFPWREDGYAGSLSISAWQPQVAAAIDEAGILINVGSRIPQESCRGYNPAIYDGKTLIHLHPDAGTIGREYPAQFGVAASISESLAMLTDILYDKGYAPPLAQALWSDRLHKEYLLSREYRPEVEQTSLADIMRTINTMLEGRDHILLNGAGLHAIHVEDYGDHGIPHSYVAPDSGAMGQDLGALVGARLAAERAGRDPVCILVIGDGGMPYTTYELLQDVKNCIVLVVNDNHYGAIESSLNRKGIHLTGNGGLERRNPDFPTLADAFGIPSLRSEGNDSFAEDFAWALNACQNGLVLLEVPVLYIDNAAKRFQGSTAPEMTSR